MFSILALKIGSEGDKIENMISPDHVLYYNLLLGVFLGGSFIFFDTFCQIVLLLCCKFESFAWSSDFICVTKFNSKEEIVASGRIGKKLEENPYLVNALKDPFKEDDSEETGTLELVVDGWTRWLPIRPSYKIKKAE